MFNKLIGSFHDLKLFYWPTALARIIYILEYYIMVSVITKIRNGGYTGG